jgi:hypothetical protein
VRALRLVAVAVCFVACQTLTEELPTRPTQSPGGPTTIAPIPVAPAPTPGPTPITVATPSPEPTPAGGGADIPNNKNPVARADAKVTGLYCNNQPMPVSTSAPVGCIIRLDVTPKDGSGQNTQARTDPVWYWSNTSFWVSHGGSAYNPTMLGIAPGSTGVYCTVDGIQSNSFTITFY